MEPQGMSSSRAHSASPSTHFPPSLYGDEFYSPRTTRSPGLATDPRVYATSTRTDDDGVGGGSVSAGAQRARLGASLEALVSKLATLQRRVREQANASVSPSPPSAPAPTPAAPRSVVTAADSPTSGRDSSRALWASPLQPASFNAMMSSPAVSAASPLRHDAVNGVNASERAELEHLRRAVAHRAVTSLEPSSIALELDVMRLQAELVAAQSALSALQVAAGASSPGAADARARTRELESRLDQSAGADAALMAERRAHAVTAAALRDAEAEVTRMRDAAVAGAARARELAALTAAMDAQSAAAREQAAALRAATAARDEALVLARALETENAELRAQLNEARDIVSSVVEVDARNQALEAKLCELVIAMRDLGLDQDGVDVEINDDADIAPA